MKGRGSILVVDDTPESLRVLTGVLRQEGYTVRPANSGKLALASIAMRPPDLILLDIRMPGLDGFEVCRRLKGDDATKNIPVIFQSAATDLADRLEGLSLGAVDYITKPFQREELLARVKTHLELALLREHLELLVVERTAQMEIEITERNSAVEALQLQTFELEEEMAERQMAQESLQEQATVLEEEVKKRQQAREEMEKLNEHLEQRVQERTAELREKNAEVQRAYDDLKRVQGQLLQQDKMASVGQLAAGVAHEINNPMGFIISNLSSLGKYVEKLKAYLDSDEKILSGCDAAIHQMAVSERQKYKIDHICKDMPELITESREGAERVRRIVQDLKIFSRIDSTEFTNADINDGLESTLAIAWNELKYKATVIRDFGQLPLAWCNPGQLNQVFLNILVNAAHAIEEQGEIRITTRTEDETVIIAISDTGSGIAPENVKRIFDPFFTTNEVGRGTGLGLSIAYDIITNKHNGRIEVRSEVGVGTTFTITLPLKAPAVES